LPININWCYAKNVKPVVEKLSALLQFKVRATRTDGGELHPETLQAAS